MSPERWAALFAPLTSVFGRSTGWWWRVGLYAGLCFEVRLTWSNAGWPAKTLPC